MKNKIVEEIVEEYFKQWEPFEVEGDHQQFSEGIFISDVEEAKERLLTTITQLHQELQKARESGREKVGNRILSQLDNSPKIKALKSISEAFRAMVIKGITRSELDQPTDLLESVKKDWDKQADDLINK